MSRVVLSVAAHGHDAEFMAGGTLAKMAAEGHEVYLAIGTNNDRGSFHLSAEELRARAEPEAEAAAAALGSQGVFMLGYVEGDLCDVRPSVLRGQVMHLIRQVKADIIFTWDPHAPFEAQPDHRAIAWATSDAARLAHLPLFHPEHLEAGAGGSSPLTPHRVGEWYWYSKSGWKTNRLIDITDTMEDKLAALYAYDCQMVLAVKEFMEEARLAGADEVQLADIDPEDYGPWIELTMRAIHGRLGAEQGVAYAEAFRYECVEARELVQSL